MKSQRYAVINTQPGTAGERLTAELRALGRAVQWLPAFQFGPPPQPWLVADTLQRLGEFDLAVFVSPQAVRAVASAMPAEAAWPTSTRAAAVGSGTAAQLRQIAGIVPDRVITPAADITDGDGVSVAGSEALWPALRSLQPAPRNVLLLRAQRGREWLTQQLQQRGAKVTVLAVYTRTSLAADAALLRAVAQLADTPLASVFTSSEAVDVVAEQLRTSAVFEAMQHGPAFAAHPRIDAALQARGFIDVRQTAAHADTIDTALRESEQIESPRGA